jgi:hypothetical protein
MEQLPAVQYSLGPVVVDGPSELAPGEELIVSVAGITVVFSNCDADGRLNVFIETDETGPQVATTDTIGRELPASEQGPPTSGCASTSSSGMSNSFRGEARHGALTASCDVV